MTAGGRPAPSSIAGVIRVATLAVPHGFETLDTGLETAVRAQLRSEARSTDPTLSVPIPIARLQQVHGDVVHVLDSDTNLRPYLRDEIAQRPAGDAIVSNRPHVIVAVSTADCVPVLIHDTRSYAVAAVHAGWRGIAVNVVGRTIERMTAVFGSRIPDLSVAIGPCAGPRRYQVGVAVRDGFRRASLPDSVFVAAPGEKQWLCDLVAAVTFQLEAAGCARQAIGAVHRCTISEADVFHSYRRDGARAGRMLSGILSCLPKPNGWQGAAARSSDDADDDVRR